MFSEQNHYQHQLTGEITQELLQFLKLKIKDNVDHVGLSQLLELLKD